MTWRPGAAVVPRRIDGYAPIEQYAAIGDGRTVALVAADGAIDWWCLPDIDGAAVCWSLLDADGGGRFTLAPTTAHTVSRRYVPNTNVLETTFTTATGAVRVTDALLLGQPGLAPLRELYRRIDGVSGRVTMRWQLSPRFDFGATPTHLVRRAGVPVAQGRGQALAVCSWDAGDPELRPTQLSAQFSLDAGECAGILLAYARGEPLVLPPRAEVDERLRETCRTWREWATSRSHDGPWREAVVRSALALKLLVYAPSGALAAAATTALPELLGGERNWDYRYCWVRDSAFILDTLTSLGCAPEAEAFFWWLMHASQLTHPRLQVLYRLDGGPQATETELALNGYRGSRPVRVGNAASQQLQLDVYGDLLEAAWRYAHTCGTIDPEIARRLAQTADLVAEIWRQPDSGIWEVRSEPQHFTQSKMMCAIALERAVALADLGVLPNRHVARWRCATSSSSTAGARMPVPTSAPPAAPMWMPRSCWRCCSATPHPPTSACGRPSTPSASGWRTGRSWRGTPVTTDWPAPRARSWPARSGSSKRWPEPAGAPGPPPCSRSCSPTPTMSVSTPKRSIPTRVRSSATFPRA